MASEAFRKKLGTGALKKLLSLDEPGDEAEVKVQPSVGAGGVSPWRRLSKVNTDIPLNTGSKWGKKRASMVVLGETTISRFGGLLTAIPRGGRRELPW